MNGVARSVSGVRYRDTGIGYSMRGLVQDPLESFPLLRDTHNLTLSNIRVEHTSRSQFRTLFSAFRETLTHLSLESIAASFSAFVTLVDYFPNITTLQVRSFVLEPDEGPVSPLSRPLRGKVLVRGFRGDHLEFLDRFTQLDLEYGELVIGPFACRSPKFLESALQISPGTVKSLRLITEIGCEQRSPLTKPYPYSPTNI